MTWLDRNPGSDEPADDLSAAPRGKISDPMVVEESAHLDRRDAMNSSSIGAGGAQCRVPRACPVCAACGGGESELGGHRRAPAYPAADFSCV